jgi:hypothetical protein
LENNIFHNILINEFDLFVTQLGIDPWIEDNKNETIFDIIDPTNHSEINTNIYSILGKHILNTILLHDTTIDPMHFTMFDKIKHNFDETTSDTYIHKIYLFI